MYHSEITIQTGGIGHFSLPHKGYKHGINCFGRLRTNAHNHAIHGSNRLGDNMRFKDIALMSFAYGLGYWAAVKLTQAIDHQLYKSDSYT